MSRITGLLAEKRPLIMGILNVTPDSFYDGGRYNSLSAAKEHALQLLQQGADIIDVGGESTRPGANPVPEQEELDRVIPVIEAIRAETDACISVDTSTASVMEQATKADCDVVNDVRALTREGAMPAAAASGLPVCLMHMQGQPQTMQDQPSYIDLVEDIKSFFIDRIEACQVAGINRKLLILDPGFGFGKTPEHNLMLINRLAEFQSFGLPLLVGLSRKSTIGMITGLSDARLSGSVAGAIVAVSHGANIVRVHDVAQTSAAFKVVHAINREQLP